MKHRVGMRNAATASAGPSTQPQPLSRTSSAPAVLQTGNPQHPNARAAAAQRAGLTMLEQLDAEFGLLQPSSTFAQTASASGPEGGAEETEEERQKRIMAEDRAAISAEIQKYEMMPAFSGNICEFWQVRLKLPRGHVYGLLID